MQITASAATAGFFDSCAMASRTFGDQFSAKITANDAARMNIVKLEDFWYDAATGAAHVRFCGDPTLVQAAVRTFQTW